MRLKLHYIVFTVLIIVTAPAQVHAGMTAEEIRNEIARLNIVAQKIRHQLIQLGDNPDTVLPGTTNPNLPSLQQSNSFNQCLQTNLQMKRGDRGGSVSTLQLFLVQSGVYSPNLVTGYYGPATEIGVQKWQFNHNIVKYGTPKTTGYGRVGPSTLRAMHKGCPGGVYYGPSGNLITKKVTTSKIKKILPKNVLVEKYSLSFNPTQGVVPFRVKSNFSITGSSCTSYSLDWGDGSQPVVYNSNKSTNCKPKNIKVTKSHVYIKSGSYSAIFKTGRAPLNEINKVNEIPLKIIGN